MQTRKRKIFPKTRILPVMKRALTISLVLFGILAVLLCACALYALCITKDVRLDERKLHLSEPCLTFYDKNGTKIEAGAAYTGVPLDNIPPDVRHAFIAVEDKRFYSHHGIDVRRMLAASWKNLTRMRFSEGASTITQQLIKNTHLSGEKTIPRKLKEIKLARALEKRHSKDEILSMYLGSIYFGHSAFGIESAAQFYFGKSASSLDTAEGAMLAALIRSPNRYSPFRNAEACKARRDLVLRLMREQGYLDKAQCEAAQKEALPTQPARTHTKSAYLGRVFDELAALFPDARSGDWGALSIQTYLDPALQAQLESTQCDEDVCLLVRDNAAQALSALHATCGTPRRLPASTIKPLLVYAPALEENLISPATPVLDARTDFNGYCPDDFRGATDAYMSVRYALAHSVNIPAVKILNELGVDRGADYLKKMDLPVDEEDKTLALALGGMKYGYTLPALADGYATFANGAFCPARTIARVTDGNGNVLFEHAPKARRVFSADVCALVNDMLQTCVREGTAKALGGFSFPLAAKTGTAEGETGNTDAYCIAYTREHVIAAWAGNADGSPTRATGGGVCAAFVKRVLRDVYAAGAPSPFDACDDVVTLKYDKTAYDTDHVLLRADPAAPPAADREELFRKCAQPTKQSTYFSAPVIRTPKILLKNGSVQIVLCQTEYYEYEIKRENRGKIATIYAGPYRDIICDNAIKAGETYRYQVCPRYRQNRGMPVFLPSVTVPAAAPPADWWIR